MNSSTHTFALKASKEQVFDFVSRIENLPRWATLFCRELKRLEDGRYRVLTPKGEILFKIEADPHSGVVDMYGGPTEEQLAYWPARVVKRGDGSLFILTAFQYPGISDAEFGAQCKGLEQEFAHIAEHTEQF